MGLQAKLLRVLQEREIEPLGSERSERVDVRVVAATNRNLRHLVDEGRFQDDLFYRLHVIPIAVPPLRDRAEDIPMLVDHFVAKHAALSGRAVHAIDNEAVLWLQQNHWPGNVRELEAPGWRGALSGVRPPPLAARGVTGVMTADRLFADLIRGARR